MKASRNFIVLGLVVLLGGVGALLWRQWLLTEELKVRAASAEYEAARRATQQTTLEKRVRVAEESATAAPKENAAAPVTIKSTARPGEATSADGNVTGEQMKQWLADANDPDVMRRLSAQARNQTMRRYAALFTQLNLPAEQTDAFIKLLIDKRQANMDLMVASLQQGEDPTNDPRRFGAQVTAAKDAIENQVHALLGDDVYAQYQAYDQNFGHAVVLNNLQAALVSSAEPLSTEQVARMTQLLEQTNAKHVSPEVVAGAKEFLSPVQMQALQDLRAIFLADAQKRLQPGQPLPTDPVAPRGKK